MDPPVKPEDGVLFWVRPRQITMPLSGLAG